MKAFWTIRPAIQNDEIWEPSFLSGLTMRTQVLGDIRLMPQGANDHKHVVVGPVALGADHYHWVFFNSGSIVQEYVGSGATHTHDIVDDPWQFAVFVSLSDADYATLLVEVPNLIILGQCAVTETPDESDLGRSNYAFGSIDNTAWDGPTRTAWETKFTAFDLTLPEIVTNDRRLVHYVLGLWNAPTVNKKNERNYRYAGAQADSGI